MKTGQVGMCLYVSIGISPFHICFVNLTVCRDSQKELYVRTQMFESLGPGIKQTYPDQLPSTKAV